MSASNKALHSDCQKLRRSNLALPLLAAVELGRYAMELIDHE